MSDTSVGNTQQLMEQPNEGISKVMEQLSLSTENSDKTSIPSKNLSDMPVDVVGLIIERSDYKEQLILRKTSKSLRTLIDKQKPTCTRIKFLCKNDCIICYYNDHCVAYVSPTGIRDVFFLGSENYRFDTVTTRTNYEEVAFDDLAFTLKNPKLQLETFSFDSECDDCCCVDRFEDKNDRNEKFSKKYKQMQNALKSINHQLSVKACRIDISRFSNAVSILPYLKPGTLEKITILCSKCSDEWTEDSETMKRFELLEQWKQAKELTVENGFDEEFPAKHATHFKRFQFGESFIESDTLVLIRDWLMKHENVEFCSIAAFDSLADLLDDIVGPAVSPNLYHYTIPDSEYYLELILGDHLLTIEKKKK